MTAAGGSFLVDDLHLTEEKSKERKKFKLPSSFQLQMTELLKVF